MKEIVPLINPDYIFTWKTVWNNGEYVSKPLALHAEKGKRIKALKPKYYNIGKISRMRQTTRVSTPPAPDYERIIV